MENTSPELPELDISLVLYHSPVELLAATCASLNKAVAQARRLGELGAVRLVVVDNSGSEPYQSRVADILATLTDQSGITVDYLSAKSNQGYGHGHNQALQAAQGQMRLILNPDVELAEDALTQGLTYLREHPEVVLLSPRAEADDGSQEFLCKRYPSVRVLLLRAFAPKFMQAWFSSAMEDYEARDLCSTDEPAEVSLASGCFMLARADALDAVSGFNDNYFLYFEDFDLSLRLAARGKLVFLPAMRIVHHGGYAASKGLKHIALFLRSGVRFFSDHGWRWI
jgi:GT2 family glycosyltransferase